MTGTWKENVSSYHKDCRRKKQSRKHTLKDKVKPLVKKFKYKNIDTDFIFSDGIVITKPEPKTKQSGFVDTFKIEVQRSLNEVESDEGYLYTRFSSKVRTAYYANGWYDEYTDEPIYGDVKKLSFIWSKEVQYDKPAVIRDRRWYSASYVDTIYIYGKPITSNWLNHYGFWSSKSRKPAAKMANRIGRAKCREWIHNAVWDAPIKNYALEKSIAWEIW